MNGLDAARDLKDIMPEVPLIMYCATPEERSETLAQSLGFSEIVSKSDKVSVLIDRARSLVYRKAA
jgi:DNA-binding NarL/FixJ family response regulator